MLEQDPTYLPKTNKQKQRSMAGTQGSIMAPLSPGMEGKVAEEDWMDILLWIYNAYMTADLGTKSRQHDQSQKQPAIITAEQVRHERSFYTGENWLKDIPGMINNKFLKSARTIIEEDSPLDPEDLETIKTKC